MKRIVDFVPRIRDLQDHVDKYHSKFSEFKLYFFAKAQALCDIYDMNPFSQEYLIELWHYGYNLTFKYDEYDLGINKYSTLEEVFEELIGMIEIAKRRYKE